MTTQITPGEDANHLGQRTTNCNDDANDLSQHTTDRNDDAVASVGSLHS
jgi:hypothetical protein